MQGLTGGKWIDSYDKTTIKVNKPATGEIVVDVARMGTRDTNDAIASSYEAFPCSDTQSQPFGGRVITVKFGDYTRIIGIDGSTEAIKETFKSAFGLRTCRAFWLQDEDQIVHCLDRDMPLGSYLLHVDDDRLAIRVGHYDESNQLPVHTEEKIFYTLP